MKVPSSSRSRSGLAWANCSSSIRAGSILGLTVIVMSFFESVVRDHSKDHAVAVVYFNDTHTPEPYTTLRDSTASKPGDPVLGLHRVPAHDQRLRGSGAERLRTSATGPGRSCSSTVAEVR